MNSGFEKRPLRYHSFILTLWIEIAADSSSQEGWRFTLQDPQTSRRRGFTELNELMHFLEKWMAERPSNEQ